MHKLARQVRFSVNPFLAEQHEGFNSYASRPTGDGLAIFLELSVEVIGKVEPTTGFIVNVVDIDKSVRKYAVPIFVEKISRDFNQAKHVDFSALAGLIKSAWNKLTDTFGKAQLSKLSLKLNPFRTMAINSKDLDMVYFSEKFEFAAMHKLWNDDFTEEKNLEVFGKCANPTGHGHNYIIEVTIKTQSIENDFHLTDFEKTINNELIKLVDHKNLNADVGHFSKNIPTVENISVFAWNKLEGKFGQASLHCVTVWETDKTYCSYYGPDNSKQDKSEIL
ncbi:MAG: 6-carboxytetrahydropterin synthase [Sedimentisphaerales bacterium]|nr:6-carboxytetrahydropterin synthase [Sedimentisphaerales bacterium]